MDYAALTEREDDILKRWLQAQATSRGFKNFMRSIGYQMELIREQALAPGDTDFNKGQVEAFKWVLSRPEALTVDDTDDTSAGE